jgi:peptidoglycan/LPS O-acetylase OafA/YrhL
MTTHGAPHSHSRIPSLDGLRALSIFAVLLGHMAVTTGFAPWLRAIVYNPHFDIADLGVRVFFVISGFLITGLLIAEEHRTGAISLGHFYLRRVLRIFPAYFAFLAVIGVLVSMKLIDVPTSDFVHAVTFTLNYVPDRAWYVGHLWSLAVEEQFYLLWPAVLALSTRLQARRTLIAVACIVPLIRVAEATFLPTIIPLINISFETAADSLAFGGLLALSRDGLWSSPLYRSALNSRWFAPTILMLGLILMERYRAGLLIGGTLVSAGIALGVDRCMRRPDGEMGRLLNAPPMVFMGTISYSLYIWQQLFLVPNSLAPLNAFPLNVVYVFAAAILSYYLVERPFLAMRPRAEQWIVELRSRGARIGD